MSIFNRALSVINETYADEYVKQHMTPLEVTKALADAGLLAPEPQVIRTRDELAALDPDTVLIDVDEPWCEVRMNAHEWMEDCDIDAEGIFPLAVLATGDEVRAARQALEDTDATD